MIKRYLIATFLLTVFFVGGILVIDAEVRRTEYRTLEIMREIEEQKAICKEKEFQISTLSNIERIRSAAEELGMVDLAEILN